VDVPGAQGRAQLDSRGCYNKTTVIALHVSRFVNTPFSLFLPLTPPPLSIYLSIYLSLLFSLSEARSLRVSLSPLSVSLIFSLYFSWLCLSLPLLS
jgi:hypothetical protein